jgi:hypothetical protein
VEYGLTDIQEYYANTGGLLHSAWVCVLGGGGGALRMARAWQAPALLACLQMRPPMRAPVRYMHWSLPRCAPASLTPTAAFLLRAPCPLQVH